jgi:hypothetical protein
MIPAFRRAHETVFDGSVAAYVDTGQVRFIFPRIADNGQAGRYWRAAGRKRLFAMSTSCSTQRLGHRRTADAHCDCPTPVTQEL